MSAVHPWLVLVMIDLNALNIRILHSAPRGPLCIPCSRTQCGESIAGRFSTPQNRRTVPDTLHSQDGPQWLARLLEVHPTFGLYRMLWELSQYAFLADFSNGEGLNFERTGDKDNGYWFVMAVWLVEWPLFLLLAWYLDQIRSDGTGARRHPLFFLGKTYAAHEQEEEGEGGGRGVER